MQPAPRLNELWLVVAMGIALTSADSAAAQGLGKPTELKDVPESVKTAASKAAPRVEWKAAIKFKEGFKVYGKNPKNYPVMATVTNEGKVLQVRVSIPLAEVPPAVRAAATAKYSDLKPAHVEAYGYDSESIRYYEFADAKKNLQLKITADGKRILP